jgi:hypothetical protein
MKRPSAPLVISCIALFVALSGTSYAVSKLPKNSVGTAQLKKNSVVSSKVKNGSLLAADFKSGQLPAGAKGDVGAQGAIGPIGLTGPAGADGTDGSDGAPGATGATGANGGGGSQGLTGPTGPSGLLGNAYSIRESSATIGTGGAVITQLSNGPEFESGELVLTAPSRLFISATMSLAANNGTMVLCVPLLQADEGGSSIGEDGWTGIDGTELASLTVSGVSEVGPGSYDIGVACRTNVDGATASAEQVTLTVIAVPQ